MRKDDSKHICEVRCQSSCRLAAQCRLNRQSSTHQELMAVCLAASWRSLHAVHGINLSRVFTGEEGGRRTSRAFPRVTPDIRLGYQVESERIYPVDGQPSAAEWRTSALS
eukprot:g62299.t1